MLRTITRLSNILGSDPELVLAASGSTACKDENFLYVKPACVSMESVTGEDFVKVERKVLGECFT